MAALSNGTAPEPDAQPDAADRPGAPGPVPTPEHGVGVPAAPATSPPEAPLVPSDAAIGVFWSTYGPTFLLVAAGLAIVIVMLAGIGGD